VKIARMIWVRYLLDRAKIMRTKKINRKLSVLVYFLKLKCFKKTFVLWHGGNIYRIEAWLENNTIVAVDKRSYCENYKMTAETPIDLIDLILLGGYNAPE
jgi:hypothetical protein